MAAEGSHEAGGMTPSPIDQATEANSQTRFHVGGGGFHGHQ